MISYNIPTYKRAGRIKTLEICSDAILWVDESEFEAYRNQNPSATIEVLPDGLQGNISRVRNYILDWCFSKGYTCCMMDDDLRGFGQFISSGNYGYSRNWMSGEVFKSFVEDKTDLCCDFGLKMWGVNIEPANRLYHQCEPFSLTKPVLGPFSVHLPNKIRYDERIPLKEDYDMFLQHMMDYGGVLRVNYAFYDCLQQKQTGGCASKRSVKEEEKEFSILQNKWGVDIVKKDKSSKKSVDINPIIKVPMKGV